jgi:segregation and condensation protein A
MDDAIATPGRITGYQVELAVFHGPLDLLLQLIQQEQLDISLVSLALITDQYLAYMTTLHDRQVEDLADFVFVAARLLLIKSRSLLPRPPLVTESDTVDPAEELLRQLQAYKRFKEAALHLAERQTEGHRSYVRLAQLPRIEPGIEHLESVPLDALVATARRVLRTIPEPASADDIVEPFSVTIQEKISLIDATLSNNRSISFVDLLTSSYTRQEVIVTLLAVLELIKQLKIGAYQSRMFGEIILIRHPEQKPASQ